MMIPKPLYCCRSGFDADEKSLFECTFSALCLVGLIVPRYEACANQQNVSML